MLFDFSLQAEQDALSDVIDGGGGGTGGVGGVDPAALNVAGEFAVQILLDDGRFFGDVVAGERFCHFDAKQIVNFQSHVVQGRHQIGIQFLGVLLHGVPLRRGLSELGPDHLDGLHERSGGKGVRLAIELRVSFAQSLHEKLFGLIIAAAAVMVVVVVAAAV